MNFEKRKSCISKIEIHCDFRFLSTDLDKWVYCRHKKRSTWEIPGGHRELGETIIETAYRELAEETGAIDAEIKAVAAYGVEKGGQQSYGMLFFANIHNLGDLPEDSEIGKIQLFDALPENLTYPEIQPHLYHSIQGWLNIQSNAGEVSLTDYSDDEELT